MYHNSEVNVIAVSQGYSGLKLMFCTLAFKYFEVVIHSLGEDAPNLLSRWYFLSVCFARVSNIPTKPRTNTSASVVESISPVQQSTVFYILFVNRLPFQLHKRELSPVHNF
jgi:hypothetical protein